MKGRENVIKPRMARESEWAKHPQGSDAKRLCCAGGNFCRLVRLG